MNSCSVEMDFRGIVVRVVLADVALRLLRMDFVQICVVLRFAVAEHRARFQPRALRGAGDVLRMLERARRVRRDRRRIPQVRIIRMLAVLASAHAKDLLSLSSTRMAERRLHYSGR